MSVVALDATTSHPSSARLRAVPSDRPLDEAPVATSQTDTTVTVVAVVFAVLAILSMFILFAAAAGSLPVVVGCALASLVVLSPVDGAGLARPGASSSESHFIPARLMRLRPAGRGLLAERPPGRAAGLAHPDAGRQRPAPAGRNDQRRRVPSRRF